MNTYPIDFQLPMFDFETLQPDTVVLTSEQGEQARQASQKAPLEQQWQVYLNALAKTGFEQWLSDHTRQMPIDWHQAQTMGEVISPVKVGQFQLCMIVVDSLLSEILDLPTALGQESQPVQFYVLVEVQEEQSLVAVYGFLRSEQLLHHRQAMPLAIQAAQPTQVPLAWFDGRPEQLLLLLECLEPPLLEVPAVPRVVSALGESVINVACWLQERLDAVAQELAWVLLPVPSLAMKSSITLHSPSITTPAEQLKLILSELRQQTHLSATADLRAAYQDFCLDTEHLRLYALVEQRDQGEWSLLTVLGTCSERPLPPGTRLLVQDPHQLLVEQELDSHASATYLYAWVTGSLEEDFTVTITLANGAVLTLPPFVYQTAGA